MTRRRKKRHPSRLARHRPGQAPGTIVAPHGASAARVRLLAYDASRMEQRDDASMEDIDALHGRFSVLWVDVLGLGDTELLLALAKRFKLHRLALEDVVNPHQRSKTEAYADQIYVVSHIARAEGEARVLTSEQISLFLGRDFVLTIQERPGDCFDAVRERLGDASRLIRRSGPDYLLYALVDAIVDHWFPIFESMSDTIEEIEEQVVANPTPETIARIRRVKRDLVKSRRLVWPMRDAVHLLERNETGMIAADTRTYLRDCYDHCLRVIDLSESYRDQIAGLSDAYMSALSHRMNEIMAVLTLIATIFIPLGFIAGLYGMNFDPDASPWNMPELGWRYGYPAALLVMGGTAAGMLLYFRRKGWLGQGAAGRREEP